MSRSFLAEASQECLSANFDYICRRSISKPQQRKYRLVPTPYSWPSSNRLSSSSTPSSISLPLCPSSFSPSLPLLPDFLLRRLSQQIYPSLCSGHGKPMETYLSGCPDDAKSNFVRRQHVSRLSKVRVDDENVPPGHDWISGGRHCSRRIESTGRYTQPNRRLSNPISDS